MRKPHTKRLAMPVNGVCSQHQMLLLLLWLIATMGTAIGQNLPLAQLQLRHDTLTLDLRAGQSPGCRISISHLADFDGHWYAMIKERDPFPYGIDQFRLFVFDRRGELLRELPLPEVVRSNTIYLDLYVEKGQLQLLPYMHNRSYRFNLAKESWIESRKRSNLVYEDAHYRVYYRDYGEWGSCSWFIDKKTKKQYITPYSTELITCFEGQYYLDHNNVLTLITDPKALLPCPPAYRYKKRRKPSAFPPVKPQGAVDIWADTTWDNYLSHDTTKLRLDRSWVADGQLLHIINDSSRLFVARRNKEKWLPILDLGPQRIYSRWHNAYRGLNPNDSTRLLFYRHPNYFNYDVLRIQNRHLYLQHWQLRYDTLMYQRHPHLEAYFELLSKGPSNFQQIEEVEAKRGSTNMQEMRKGTRLGYYLPPQEPPAVQFTQMYRTVIDSILTIRTEHTFRASDSTWLGSRFEFIQSRSFIPTFDLKDLFPDKKPITQYMDSLQSELIKAIELHFGPNSCTEPAGLGQFRTEWVTSQGSKLKLEGKTDFSKWASFHLVLQAAPSPTTY